MSFAFSYDANGVTLQLLPKRTGLISRLLARQHARSLEALPPGDRELTLALADLRALGDSRPGELQISGDTIRISHALAGKMDARMGQALGLPPLVDLVLRTDVEGLLGTPFFRLHYEWLRHGRRQMPKRTGAILETSEGARRLPAWMMEALDVAEGFSPDRDDASHWEALARFRQALDPGVQMSPDMAAARVSLTDFLQGLEVRLADRFSISPKQGADGPDFDVVPFSGRRLEESGLDDDGIAEAAGELTGNALHAFQGRVRGRGALPAYRVGDGSYLVIDRGAAPVLDVMVEMQRASPQEREEFIRNPRRRIARAVEDSLRGAGRLDGLTPAGEEEAIEAIAGPVLVETREYSERVTGIRVYEKPALDLFESSGTTWLPEYFAPAVREAVARMDSAALEALEREVGESVLAGRETVEIAGEPVPASSETLRAVQLQREARAREEAATRVDPQVGDKADAADADVRDGPIIIETKDNFEELHWRPERGPRTARIPRERTGVATALKQHQAESLDWQIAAWCAGLPGMLNADEQGLGKTLQTLSFLRWLKGHMSDPHAEARGPVLIVAPTSLLQTWEGEVARHLEEPGLGHLIRLYGSGLGGHRRAGKRGVDTESGEDKLDFGLLHEAVAEGRAHRFWMLTTYTTLTNYQHSLARLPFSAVVFDEIQALKNPVSLRALAARAVRADFRIGLTGTPIENSTVDLWAIMDQLCPGALGTLREFRSRYAEPDDDNMRELHARVFLSQGDLPPLALRRMKETVARDLPEKGRRLHPRVMPGSQAAAYEEARSKLAEGSRGSALKMLHHIRTVSVHPALQSEAEDDDFISASGRLAAAFDILRGVKARGERALVFIEHRQMQYRFIELVRQDFGLSRIDLINGDTPIAERQKIVDRFQRHLSQDGGFDLLVLGPKAAGTGLTLTAATHVIHLSRWWNPAVEEQCNDRVHRIGQGKPVTVHVPMAVHPGYREHSFDCLLHSLMTRKRRLATAALWPMGDTAEDAAALQRMVAEARNGAGGDPVSAAMAGMFARDGKPLPPFSPDGSLPVT